VKESVKVDVDEQRQPSDRSNALLGSGFEGMWGVLHTKKRWPKREVKHPFL
jgi:hypothetical protein